MYRQAVDQVTAPWGYRGEPRVVTNQRLNYGGQSFSRRGDGSLPHG
jgi:hypothetical protein